MLLQRSTWAWSVIWRWPIYFYASFTYNLLLFLWHVHMYACDKNWQLSNLSLYIRYLRITPLALFVLLCVHLHGLIVFYYYIHLFPSDQFNLIILLITFLTLAMCCCCYLVLSFFGLHNLEIRGSEVMFLLSWDNVVKQFGRIPRMDKVWLSVHSIKFAHYYHYFVSCFTLALVCLHDWV